MSKDTGYNGWTNRETWLYGLWFDSDYDAELAKEAYNEASADRTFTRKERARLNLAETLEANFDEYMEQMKIPDSGIIADLLGGAVGAINWQEIAEHLMDSVDEQANEETEVA